MLIVEKAKELRFKNFLLNDKDKYICFRFTLALEKLMPSKYEQVPYEILGDKESSLKSITIETTPKAVYERYIYRLLQDPEISLSDIEEVEPLVVMYCDYLESDQEKRLKMYTLNQQRWNEFI